MRVVEVVAGVDDSDAGHNAADWAASRANILGVRLNIVRVVPGPWAFRRPAQYREAMEGASDLLLAEASRLSAQNPDLVVVSTRRTGETPIVLRLLSETAETVVVGSDRAPDSHGEGFGSVSFQTAVSSRCPVAVVPAAATAGKSGVVVGVDGSGDSRVALKFAAAEAVRTGEDLVVLHVVAAPDASVPPTQSVQVRDGQSGDGHLLLSVAAGEVTELYPGLNVRQLLEPGDSPADAIIRAAADARLLVIGCRGGGSARKLVGAIAAKVLQHLPCPTIVTRPAAPASGPPPHSIRRTFER